VSFSAIGQECAVSYHTVQEYFQILIDTLLGSWLIPFRKRPKRRVVGSPKFYFFDVGVVNFLAKRHEIEPGSELFGKAFENWVFHELSAYNSYSSSYADLSFWRLTSGIEVDFIVNDMEVAIEAKSSRKITSDQLKGLRSLVKDHPDVKKRMVVSLEEKEWKTEDGITVLPYQIFCRRLWSGEIF
jgi:predicted AAA+ superfamily ATPase